MPVIASDGPEAHAEAAWQELHTPGTTAGARAEALAAFTSACRAIAEHGAPAVERLAALTLSTDPAATARAEAAARILAEIGTTEAATALVHIALSQDIAIAGRALDALPSMRISQAAQTLLLDAVHAASHGPGAEAQRRSLLGPGLARQLVSSDDFDVTAWARVHPFVTVRAAWARALSRAGGAAAAAYLPAMTDDPEASVRAWAAFGLVLEGETAALSLLVRCTGSRRSEERAAAVGLLGVLPLPAAVPPVLAATMDRSPVVACAALVRAAHLGVRSSLLALAEHLEHARADVVEHAAWALRELFGEDPGFGWSGRRLTPASVARVRARCRAAHELWAPELRYLQGRPVTAQAMAALLDEPPVARAEAAFFTLLGMCGCSFGFDPAADVVANQAPIRKLKTWAQERGRALLPGAFYCRGALVKGRAHGPS